MYKCKNCGTEFESKFCPNCGTPAPTGVCPYCGSAFSAENKFCPACGRPLAEPAAAPPAPATASPALVKSLSFLPAVTAVLFALFSVLLFLMLLGSVSSVMGFGTGSVYEYLSMGGSGGGMSDPFGGGMSEVGGLGAAVDVCIALVVFAAFGAVLSAVALAFRLSLSLRARRAGSIRVCTLLDGSILLFYLIDFLLGCILCGVVSDEMTAPGAAPVCVLVFALLFGLCSAGAIVVQKKQAKFFPSAAAELERQRARRRAALTPPVKPERKALVKPKEPKYSGGTCSEELEAKVLKYVKSKNLFTTFTGIFFPLFGLFLFLMCGFLGIFGDSNIYYAPTFSVPAYGILLMIFGSIFGTKYQKKKMPNFDWQSRHTWSNKKMFWTVSVCSSLILLACVALTVVLAVSARGQQDSTFVVWGVIFTFPFYVLYAGVFYPVAGALAHKGKKLSLAVYGAKHPRLAPQVHDDEKTYEEQRKTYRAARKEQRRTWQKYYRDLACYEEGIPYGK